jgi:hypothetical protein
MLSGCNSTESIHSQGPWGPSHIRRNYPQYAAPWGKREMDTRRTSSEVHSAALTSPSVQSSVSWHKATPVMLEAEDPAIAAAPPPVAPSPQAWTSVLTEQAAPTQGSPPPAPAPAPSSSAPDLTGVAAPRQAASYAGTWKALVAGSPCRIMLSSVATLDLYRASAPGCSNDDLRSVNAWSFGHNSVVLFSKGVEVARLSGVEASLSGTLSKSGAALAMSR